MSLKIGSTGLFARTWLQVQSDGITFVDAAGSSAKQHFRYNEIECILLSADSTKLSFQVREKVFTVPVNPNDKTHQTVIATFVAEAQRAGAGWAPPP